MTIDFSSYTVIDVETPNRKNDSICSIACMNIVNGEIKNKVQYFVNPECAFDNVNMKINGITPDQVADKPNFAKVWENIKDFFSEKIIVAHNATFDLSVIKKSLERYGIAFPKVYYFCTMELAKHFMYDDTTSKKGALTLNAICDTYNIPLTNHHDSLCDVIACDEIFSRLFSEYQFEPLKFVQEYSCSKTSVNGSYNVKSHSKPKYSMQNNAISEFRQLVEDLNCEGRPELEDILNLINWVLDHPKIGRGKHFTKLYDICTDLYSERNFNDTAIIPLMSTVKIFSSFYNQSEKPKENEIPCIKCDISFSESVFCLTGNFKNCPKSEIKEKLETLGAICKDNVTKKTNYLIIGENGDASWKYGNYGTKVVKAIDMQNKGHTIKIVAEKDFMPFLNK